MSSEQNEIWEVLAKNLTEELTSQEQQLLNNWLNESISNQKSYDSFLKLRFPLTPNESDKYKKEIFDEITTRIANRQRATKRLWVFSSIAATLILLITTAIVFFHYGEKKTGVQLIETLTPKGIKSKVILSDGSTIVLNSNSKIIYPYKFYGKNREIRFEGEGYFTIAKDKEHPFIVKTSTIKVQVVGTRFNLKSYENDDLVETTLNEGSVKILGADKREFQIVPGKQAVFNKRLNAFRILNVDPEKISSWQDDKFYFVSKSFEEIAHVLERRFDVTIEIQSEKLKKEVFSGDFIRGENLEQILTIIEKNTNITFRKKGQLITITEE